MTEVQMSALICFIGLALHFCMKWAEARQVEKLGFLAYAKSVPAVSMVAVLSTAGAFLVTHSMDWLNPGMAFACGYMGNSIADNLASQFAKQS